MTFIPREVDKGGWGARFFFDGGEEFFQGEKGGQELFFREKKGAKSFSESKKGVKTFFTCPKSPKPGPGTLQILVDP